MPSPLATIATELYSLAPEDFTAARDSAAKRARAEGDRELAEDVKALRRPPVAAWLANTLVRARAEDVDDLLALGVELREAQDALDGAALRTMTHQRQQVVRGLSKTAQQLVGKPVADTAVRELESTLDAALADESAAQALRSGRLMRALSSTGLEAVDLHGAVAAPDDLPAPKPERVRATAKLPPSRAAAKKAPAKAAPRRAEANERAKKLAAAQAALADASAEFETADSALTEAREAVAAIDAELAELQRQLDGAGERRVAAEHERRAADAARKAAARARDAAQRAVATAKKRGG